jgi:hypothetical protein
VTRCTLGGRWFLLNPDEAASVAILFSEHFLHQFAAPGLILRRNVTVTAKMP